jgi:sortase A
MLLGRHRDALLRWVERALIAGGLACLVWSGVVWAQAALYQREQRHVLDRMLTTAPRQPLPLDATFLSPAHGALIGSLDVPRVDLSVMVVEGDDASALRVGVGHLPDTPLPWEHGNSTLAGHRDTFFRALRDLRLGDHVSLTTVHGDLQYRVSEIFIVDPNDLWVLEPADRPILTLVTCYPFSYVGPAPKRFIVRAERQEAHRGEMAPVHSS